MDQNQRRMVLTTVLNAHRQSFLRLLRARNMQVMEVIRQSRLNLVRRQRASLQSFRETLLSITALAVMSVTPRVRTIGRKERTSRWWNHDVLETYRQDQWIEDFRMDRPAFFGLVDMVRNEMAGADNVFVEGLSVEEKVAIAVYRLASCAEYRVVGNTFGVHKSTVCECVHTFCKTIIAVRLQDLLSWPSFEECGHIAASFEEKYYLPNVVGVIDGTHIPVSAPKSGGADFLNRKRSHSIVMQGVVDNRMLFRNVTAQHPGCNHDASVLRDSHLYRNHHNMFPPSERDIHGMADGNNIPIVFRLPYYFIGDPAYPLSDWLLKDYRTETTPEEVSFNLYLNTCRVIVEHAFGRLKGRWRILSRRSDLDVYNMPHVIVACCMLHNYVEMANQVYLPRWDQERLRDEVMFPQPRQVGVEDGNQGQLIRDHLCAYLARNFPLLTRENDLM